MILIITDGTNRKAGRKKALRPLRNVAKYPFLVAILIVVAPEVDIGLSRRPHAVGYARKLTGGGSDCLRGAQAGSDAAVESPPRPVLLLANACAAIRKALAARFTVFGVFELLIWPPVIRLLAQRPSQETKRFSVGNFPGSRVRIGPGSSIRANTHSDRRAGAIPACFACASGEEPPGSAARWGESSPLY